MAGIPPDLRNRLQDVLARCGPFDSNAALYTSFTDARIAAWRDRIPDNAYNRGERITALIEALYDQYNIKGENALVLFLHVLADYIPLEDTRHNELAQLTNELQTCSPIALTDSTIVQTRLDMLPLDVIPDPAPLPPGSRIPFRVNPHFVGRADDLKQLATMLKGGRTVAVGRIVAAVGLGGIGKTQLATEFAHRYGRYFAGGVFWLDFSDPASIPAEIATCGGAGALDLRPDFGTLPLPDQVALVLSAWRSPLPRLLIFDNCEDENLLTQWCPTSGGGCVLVTSRLGNWSITLGVQVLHLDVLSRVESLILLRRHCPDLSDPDADAIAAELGDLPLALHLAGSFLATYRRVVTPGDYLTQLRHAALLEHQSLQGRGATHSPTDHEQHVQKTFAVSYERLDSGNPTDAMALALLARAAYFAPGVPIPCDLLTATLQINRVIPIAVNRIFQFLRRLVARGKRSSEFKNDTDTVLQAEDALTRLITLGLLSGDLTLHRLLAAFVRANMADARAQVVVEKALLAEAKRLNANGYPTLLLTWQPHLRFVTDAAQTRSDVRAAGLCNALGYHLSMIGDYTRARSYLERALAIREHILGYAHPSTAASLNNLGALLQATGDLEGAQSYYERALTIHRKQVLGSILPDTAVSLNNLGALLQAMGNLAEARPYYERALVIRKHILGYAHPDTADSFNNLGQLLEATGDLAEAQSYVERALAIYEQTLGPTHPNTAVSLNNLGHLLQATGDLEGAQSYYERALAIYEQVFGLAHLKTALSLNNLGMLLADLGDLPRARSYVERALSIREQILGFDHPAIAISLINLGVLMYAMGDLPGAQSCYARALAINEQALGPDHPDTATSLNNLAVLCYEEGNFADAARMMRRALAIREARLGSEHPDTQTLRQILANVEARLLS